MVSLEFVDMTTFSDLQKNTEKEKNLKGVH